MGHFFGCVIWEFNRLPSFWQEYYKEAQQNRREVALSSLSMKLFIEADDLTKSSSDLKIIETEKTVLIVSGRLQNNRGNLDDAFVISAVNAQLELDNNLPGFLRQFDGEFTIVGINKLSGEVFLATDPIGHRNLYYRKVDGGILWGSNSLIVSKDNRILDVDSLNLYLSLKGIPAPYSIIKDVNKIPPGTSIDVIPSGVEQKTYWFLNEIMKEPYTSTYEEAQEELLQKLKSSISNCLGGINGKLGIFLSGGLDSSILVSLAKSFDIPLETYTVGYVDASFTDETDAAASTARLLGVSHTKYKCSPNEILELIQRTVSEQLEPVADSAFFPQLLLAQSISTSKIILDGSGADSIFGGSNKFVVGYYQRFFELIPGFIRKSVIFPIVNLFPASRSYPLTNAIRKLQFFIEGSNLPKDQQEYFWSHFLTPHQLNQILLPGKDLQPGLADNLLKRNSVTQSSGSISKQSYTTLKTLMPTVDLFKLSNIANITGINICNPYLSVPVIEMGLRLPDAYKFHERTRKRILRDIGNKVLPGGALNIHKNNFNPPINTWIKGPIREIFMDTLNDRNNVFSTSQLTKFERENRLDWRDFSSQLWAIFILLYWLKSNSVIIP